MNDIRELVSRILSLIGNENTLDMKEFHKAYSAYSQAAAEFNQLMAKCAGLFRCGKESEAQKLLENMKTLPDETARFFSLQDHPEFQEFCSFHAIAMPGNVAPLPLEIKKYVYDILSDEFRRISRTGSVASRIHLLRRIVNCFSDAQQLEILADLESSLHNELADKAKKAIISSNFSELENIRQELTAPGWVYQVNPAMLKKINSVLRGEKVRQASAAAQKIMVELLRGFSKKDLKSLQKDMAEYESLLKKFPEIVPAPDSGDGKVLADIRQFISAEVRKNAEEAEFNHLVNSIKEGLKNNCPPHDLDKFADGIEKLNRSIPEDIAREYQKAVVQYDTAIRRKKLRRIISTVLTTVVVAGILGGAGYAGFMLFLQNKWLKKLDLSLQQDTADVTLAMLDDLEQKYPSLCRKVQFVKLAAAASKKKADEDHRRREFDAVTQQMDTYFQQGKYHKDLESCLKRLESLIVDSRNRAAFEAMTEKVKNFKAQIVEANNHACQEKLIAFNQLCNQCSAAISRGDSDSAKAMLKAAAELQKEMFVYNEISGTIRRRIDDTRQTIQDVEVELNKLLFRKNTDQHIAELHKSSGILAGELKSFNEALERKDLKAAAALCKSIARRRSSLGDLSGIPESVMTEYVMLFEELAQIDSRYTAAVDAVNMAEKRLQECRELLKSIPAYKDFKSFHNFAGKLSWQSDIDKVIPGFSVFYSDCATGERLAAGDLESVNCFARDIRNFREMEKIRGNRETIIRRKLIDQKQRVDDSRMIVLQNADQKLCTIIYSPRRFFSSGNNFYTLYAYSNRLHSDTVKLWIEYDPQSENVSVMDVTHDKKLFQGKLIYPDNITDHKAEWNNKYLLQLANDVTNCPEKNSLEQVFSETINTVSGNRQMHPALRIRLIRRLLNILREAGYSPVYSQWCEAVKRMESKLGDAGGYLDDNRNNSSLESELALICSNYNRNLPWQQNDLQFDALKSSLSRKLRPAGVISIAPGAKDMQWHRFSDAPESGEVWVMQDDRFVIRGTYNKNQLDIVPPENAPMLQMVFSPADQRKTLDLQIKLDASGAVLPESWPVRRF
ncbi:MAG: hypothetical protein E7057_05195 [Lentisphaerae bacterium]|nr:hypothetical protein [Lentisphaerota bacterium]